MVQHLPSVQLSCCSAEVYLVQVDLLHMSLALAGTQFDCDDQLCAEATAVVYAEDVQRGTLMAVIGHDTWMWVFCANVM